VLILILFNHNCIAVLFVVISRVC